MRIQSLVVLASALALLCISRSDDSAVVIALEMETEVDTCTLEPYTLSFDCDGICDQFSPCLKTTQTATTTTSSLCDYKCFQVNDERPNDYDTFRFLIPYTSSASEQETSGEDESADTVEDETTKYPSASNDLLKKMEQLKLPSTTTTV